MKKATAITIALVVFTGIFSACSLPGTTPTQPNSMSSAGVGSPAGIQLTVVTSFGADDGNRQNYVNACEGWSAESGYLVRDISATSDEKWKAQVLADFETGSDPDVLFFFTGADANPIIGLDKVVPLDEIRSKYPGYAGNMAEDEMPASPLDGNIYAVPSTGFWEGLYVNTSVLEQTGVPLPGPTTSWQQFQQYCQQLLAAGITPIAVSLANVPHYWFEFCILNNGGAPQHLAIPHSVNSPSYQSWVAGLYDIKDMYDRGYFPKNTLTATDDETFALLASDRAAFAIDGSWKIGWFEQNGYNSERFTVTYVPAKEARQPTDIIGGFSMGYYITRKAWSNPEKREAAVSFVQYMTSDNVVQAMARGLVPTALTQKKESPAPLPLLQQGALDMVSHYTNMVPPVQDLLSAPVRDKIMAEMIKLVVSGQMTPEEAVQQIMVMVG